MNRNFIHILTGIASSAALVVAGSAFANVPNDDYVITDKDESGTGAFLDVDGEEYEVEVGAECGDFDDSDSETTGSAIFVESNHPDDVELKKNKGEVGQGEKDNEPDAFITTGSGDGQLTNRLSCEKLEVEADIKTKKDLSGSFSADGKNCTCDAEYGPGDCGVYGAQLGLLGTDCDGNKTVSGSFKDGDIKKFKIKGKGDAVVAD